MLQHEPVLIQEVEKLFIEQKNKNCVIDATLGLGGHAKMLISHMDQGGCFIWIDRDRDNLEIAKANLSDPRVNAPKIHLVHNSFADLESIIGEISSQKIDFILYDLWVSSAHYDEWSRGFSVRHDAPLDMRFDRTTWKTAEDLIRELDARSLMHIFSDYSDEKKAFFIANAIVEARKNNPIRTTADLLKIVSESSFDKKSPIRVFQALRIAVNKEFEHIEKSLTSAVNCLDIWWKIAIITFHSIEDRLVKHFFDPFTEPVCDPITWQIVSKPILKKVIKKPIEPTEKEIQNNPRSRSAKLRILEKIN